jgi:hypothetical protein
VKEEPTNPTKLPVPICKFFLETLPVLLLLLSLIVVNL